MQASQSAKNLPQRTQGFGDFLGALCGLGGKMGMKGLFSVLLLTAVFPTASWSQIPTPSWSQVLDKAKLVAGSERAFEKVSKTVALPAPGCVVGVSLNGESVFEKAFGLAELEHGTANTAQTVFESGSVAKQFTAAALVLLQQDGKLSIDDPVRKYIPELPDYGVPLTIRHMLNHTSGIRDWFSVRALSGEGASDHIVTQQMIFDTVVRQKGLDFKPGAEYSYSNSGYQLAAMIVERVSKQKFADFVSERIFKPVGMTNSAWRDDHRRVVSRRAQAYSPQAGNAQWRLNMPMMNGHGGGGMLTTVGDWLKWNAMLDAKTWNAPLVDSLETQGVLNSGRTISYALGLMVGSYKGNRQIAHSGSTAGYRTFLARYPDKKVSIGVLCNSTANDPTALANDVADEVLGPFPESAASTAESLPVQQPEKYVGLWKNERNKVAIRISLNNGELRFGNVVVRALTDGSLMAEATKLTFRNDGAGKPVSFDATANNDTIRYTAVAEWQPVADDLAEFSGDWYSDDAEATVRFSVEGQNAFASIKHAPRLALKPLYKDCFTDGSGRLVWFVRDSSGKPLTMHVGGARMRDMPFVRVGK